MNLKTTTVKSFAMKSRLLFTALLFAAALACTVSCGKAVEFSSLAKGIAIDQPPECKDLVFFGSTLGRCWVFTDTGGNILKAVKRTGISYRTYYFEDITY